MHLDFDTFIIALCTTKCLALKQTHMTNMEKCTPLNTDVDESPALNFNTTIKSSTEISLKLMIFQGLPSKSENKYTQSSFPTFNLLWQVKN